MAKRRQAEGRPPAPAMAIVSGRLDLDLDGPLFRERDSTPILVTGADAPADKVAAAGRRCEVLVAGDGTHVDLSTALRELAARGYRRISCEGGPSLLGQLLAAGLVDELCLTISPLLLGGDAVNLLDGVALHTPLDLNLHQVLAEDGFLFTSYRVGADAAHPA
jgi:riboflavin biosynthesis pyrimidine reductase